jgi:hypothetical protein
MARRYLRKKTKTYSKVRTFCDCLVIRMVRSRRHARCVCERVSDCVCVLYVCVCVCVCVFDRLVIRMEGQRGDASTIIGRKTMLAVSLNVVHYHHS